MQKTLKKQWKSTKNAESSYRLVLMEYLGGFFFLAGGFYAAYQIMLDRKAVNADRRKVWTMQKEVFEEKQKYKTKQAEINKGFDWNAYLPQILQFLGSKGLTADEEEVKKILSQLEED